MKLDEFAYIVLNKTCTGDGGGEITKSIKVTLEGL
jgi:hypothetical protein